MTAALPLPVPLRAASPTLAALEELEYGQMACSGCLPHSGEKRQP